jgi:ATP-binding cassette subfamily B protein
MPKPNDPGRSPARQGTFRAILRIYPFARSASRRILLGMVAALLAGIVALLIPQVLKSLVDGPLKTGDSSQIWPAVGIVLALGVPEREWRHPCATRCIRDYRTCR